MAKRVGVDKWLFGTVLLLVLFGLVMVFSASAVMTKATTGSNVAHVTARVDPRTGWVVALCALDNLVKGASGQAVQCANAALGLAETSGLPIAGLYP